MSRVPAEHLKACPTCGYKMLDVEVDCLRCELLDGWKEELLKRLIAERYRSKYPHLREMGVEL